jgi:hypothetical protein
MSALKTGKPLFQRLSGFSMAGKDGSRRPCFELQTALQNNF